MTRKITDAELENIDGGLDQLQENPTGLDPKGPVVPPLPEPGNSGGPGGGIADDFQQTNDRPGNDT